MKIKTYTEQEEILDYISKINSLLYIAKLDTLKFLYKFIKDLYDLGRKEL